MRTALAVVFIWFFVGGIAHFLFVEAQMRIVRSGVTSFLVLTEENGRGFDNWLETAEDVAGLERRGRGLGAGGPASGVQRLPRRGAHAGTSARRRSTSSAPVKRQSTA